MDYTFILYFIVYGFLFCLLLPRTGFIKRAGLEPWLVRLLFGLKVLAGLAIGWISLHVYGPANDYWDLNREGMNEYRLLTDHPAAYFKNFFHSDYEHGYSGFFSSFQSFWNDLKNNLVIKLLSVFNILTNGNYYLNSLFFNAFIFSGHVAFYRLFIYLFPQRKWLVLIGCFLLPSTLYFSSGIHRDGLVFLLLGLFIYAVFFCLRERPRPRYILLAFFSIALLFILRNYIVVALLPALAGWVIVRYTGWTKRYVFAAVYLLFWLLFFGVNRVVPALDPPSVLVQKQADYLQLTGASTRFQLNTLEPHVGSFAANMIQSYNHALLRPYVWELPVRSMLPFCLELFVYQLLFILFIFFHRKKRKVYPDGFSFFLIFFILTAFLFIGYIVPNLGTLVRYRALYFPLMITPLLAGMDWERLGRFVKIKK